MNRGPSEASPEPRAVVGGATRLVRVGALLVLGVAAALILTRIHDFAETRFFTIDEYQYGHATWLVAQGRKPYRDFYEHHFPLGYVLHAPLLPETGSFSRRALRLRQISFGYLLGLCAVLGMTGYAATRDPFAALLSGFVPVSVGFGLMSAVDYRADNFAACLAVACFAILEANRSRGSRFLAGTSGVLLALAVGMTQKTLVVVVPALALMLGIDLARRHRPGARPFVRAPGAFLASVAAVGIGLLGAGAVLGLLGPGFEATILHAIGHESAYPEVPVGRFVAPYLSATAFSTGVLVLLAVFYLTVGRSGFWAIALGVALLGVGLMRARYPYNYVLPCLLLGLCAARGWALGVRRLPLGPRLAPLRPLFVLAPLVVLPAQLGFVSGTSSNEHQLRLLDKVQRFTRAGDVVIDGAGGALFRDHASYYWYHGGAHRQLFADYFAERLAEDYRRSQALFWIRDLRMRGLSQSVHDYFRSHYVRADGDLFALGFRTPGGLASGRELEIDVVRPGRYLLHASDGGEPELGGGTGVRIDGREVGWEGTELNAGSHRLRVAPGTPPYILSPLPAETFRSEVGEGRIHSPTFEYGERRRGRLG